MNDFRNGRFASSSGSSSSGFTSSSGYNNRIINKTPQFPLRADQPFPIDRQDSLMLCQQLQEKDPLDFMDESMDLTPYLNNLHEFDVDGEDLEPLVDKQRLIENDIYAQNAAYPNTPLQYAELSAYDTQEVESAPEEILRATSTPYSPQTPQMPLGSVAVKAEAPWEEDSDESFLPTTSAKKEKAELFDVPYTPTIKPRKYSLKPEAEKKNPSYRLKREKNNDAVRKSRTKAKEQQKQREEQVKGLEERIVKMAEELKVSHSRNADLEGRNRLLNEKLELANNENFLLKKHCRCNAVSRIHR